MQTTKVSSSEKEDTHQSISATPRISVVAGAETRAPASTQANVDRDWDPYVVWKKLIRRNPDTA